MTQDNLIKASSIEKIGDLLSSETYRENIDFWQRAWNSVKSPYTQMPDLPYLVSIPAWLKERRVQSVLDLGCGSGWLSIYLARQGFTVTGLDIAEHAIHLARMWADQEELEIEFDIGDIAEMEYAMGSFEAVVANSIFEHLTYELARHTVKRLKSLLLPGGSFIGCFDRVGTGPGQYYELEDGSHIYTDKGRKGMLLRNFSNAEIQDLFSDWTISKLEEFGSGSRFLCAHT
jgi:SAM-dependent methyltransferase